MRSPNTYVCMITRQKPVNLQDEDFHLFEKVLSANIADPHTLHIHNANILKDHIFDARRFTFYTSYSHILHVPAIKRWKKLLWFAKPYHTIEGGIWVTDEWSGEYFHWLTDALTRLIMVEPAYSGYPVLLPARYEQIPYIRASLDILHVKACYYDPRKRLAVKELVLPGHTAPTGNYHVPSIHRLRERLMTNTPAAATKKIYVSRRKAGKRTVLNESAVVELLLGHGYEAHCFEDYSFAGQLALMCQAKALIGLHGAGLTNMLFMQGKGQVLELRNNDDAHNNCFFSLASALEHRYYYLTNKGSLADTHHADVWVDIARLAEVIELMEREEQYANSPERI